MTEGKMIYEVGFEVDKISVADVKKSLQEFQNIIDKAGKSTKISDELKKASESAKQLSNILDGAWNNKLGEMNLTKVNEQIKKTFGSVGNLKKILEDSGSAGSKAYNDFSRSILNTNLQLTQSNKLLDSMAVTMSNTVKWGVTSKIFNTITGSIEKAWSYTKALDQSLNDIRIVTGKSSDEMERFAVQANKAAKSLGSSTRDYTNASLIYYQQGLADKEVAARAETTLKAANVTGQRGEEVSEQLTAVWNGYKVTAEETELYIDKLAAVAASTAADLEELSVGMSKVASAANIMGVDVDQLNAQLATIVSVTRQAPESVGVALKTIYARMGDIEAGLDDETTLGKYTEDMAALGVNVLDMQGNLREMGDVIEEIGNKWTSLSKEQQIALSQTMAGTRQYNNLLALFDNWDMYTDALETSANAAGTLQEQQDIFMDSTAAHLQKLRTESERTYDILFDTDTVNGFTDALTGTLNVFNDFIAGIGGGTNAFTYFGSVLSNIFSKQIARSINQAIDNVQKLKDNASQLELMKAVIDEGYAGLEYVGDTGVSNMMYEAATEDYKRAEDLLNIQKYISEEDFNRLNAIRQEIYERGLVLNRLDEILDEEGNINITQKEANLQYKEASKELTNQLKLRKEISKNMGATDSGKKLSKESVANLQKELELLKTKSLTERESAIIEEAKLRLSEKGGLTATQKNKILEIEEKIIKDLNNEEQKRLLTLKAIEAQEKGIVSQMRQEKEELEKTYKEDTGNISRNAQLSDTITALSSIVQLSTSLSGIWKTLNDEDLSGFEKFEQIMSNLLVTLPMLIMNFDKISSSIGILATKMGVESAAAGGGLLSSLAGIVEVAGPYALAAAAIGAAIFGIIKILNQESDAAKKASEEAKKAKEDYEEIKNSYQELTSSISNYGDSLNALNKLEKGTQKWKQAVLDLNEQVLKLIENYPQLANFVINDEGLLKISEEGINQVLDQQWKFVQSSYRAKNEAQMESAEKQLNLEKSKFRSNISYVQNIQPQSQQSSLFEERQDFGRELKQSQIVGMTGKELDDLVKALQEHGLVILKNKEELQKATNFNSELVDALWENKKSILELNDSIIKNTNSNDLLNITNAQSKLTGISQYNRLSEEDQTRIAKSIAKRAQEIPEGDYSTFSKSKIRDAYAEMIDYTGEMKTKKGKTYFSIGDQEIGLTTKEMRKQLEDNAALEQAIKSTDKYIQALELMTSATNKAAENLGLVGLEYQNTAQLMKTGFQGEFDFSVATDDQLKALSELRKSDEWKNVEKTAYEAAGYESAKAFSEAFDKELEEWNKEEKSQERAQNLANATQMMFEQALKKDAEALDVTESALRTYTEHLIKNNKELEDNILLAEKVAAEAIEFANGVDKLAKALSSNEQLLKDWKDGLTNSVEALTAVSEVQDALQEMFGIRVSEDYVKNNLDDLILLANGSTEALERLQEAATKDFVIGLKLNEEDEINLLNKLDYLNNQNIEIGTSIDDQNFIDGLNSMIKNANLTEEEVQQALDSIGYEPEFEEVSADTPPQATKASTTMTYKSPIGDIDLGVLETSTTIDGVSASMFGISNASSGKSAKARTIKSVTKKSDVGSRSSAIKNLGQSGKKVGGKGGGGSKGSKEPEKIDALEGEKDRYHDINIILKQIETEMSRLEKQQDKLFGKDLIDNLNKQLDQLNKKMDSTKEKIKIAQGELGELRDKLGGEGVLFNEDGTISNYAAAYDAQLNYVNAIINQYNSMGAEAQEAFKETVDKAKEDFEKFKDNINKYDTLISDTIPGLEDDIQDAIDKQIEIQIKSFNMEIEIRLDLSEAERDWNQFKKKIIDGILDEDILGNTKARLLDFSSYYKTDDTGIVQANAKHVNDILNQLYQMDATGTSSVYGDNRKQALEDLQNYYKQLMSDLKDVQDLQEEIHESYIKMMDETQEKFDEQVKTYEIISDLIDHDMKVISLVYGEESYNKLSGYYKQQEDNYNKQLNFQRQQLDFWRAQMDQLEENSKEWENARKKWESAVTEWNNLVENAIENLQDKFLNAINEIFQNLNNKVTGDLGLGYVNEEWDLINTNAEQYLDTINAMYGIQKLENKYLDAISKTDSLSAQRKLRDIMEEQVSMLQQQDKLTQYDIERANMKYEIALKQIALQEAQQNKSTMRLRRDSQGNYSYQYVADTDAVGSIQDELGDMYNSLYNFDKNRYQENLNQLYDAWAEFQEKMAEAAQINDPEQRAEKEMLLREQYGELINGLVEQNETVRLNLHESAFDDLTRLYDENVKNFEAMNAQEKDSLLSDLIPYWESGVQHMADVFAGEGGFAGVCQDAIEELHDATKDYEDSLNDLEQSASVDFESIAEGIDENIDRTEDLLQNNSELIESYREELNAIAEVISELDTLTSKYNAAKEAAIAATTAAYNYWAQEQRLAAKAAGNNSSGSGANTGNQSGNTNNNNNANASRSGGNGSGQGDGNLTVGDTATFTGSYYYDSYGTAPVGSRYAGITNGIIVDIINNNPYGVHIKSADGKFPDLGWVKRTQLTGYDTGGYTGSWGNSGRLALLHQKELVLNANDTSNMLNAVSILRSITDNIGSNILTKLATISSYNTTSGLEGSGLIEQNVTINADFPNATSQLEIENAFNNLVNIATQRINRR